MKCNCLGDYAPPGHNIWCPKHPEYTISVTIREQTERADRLADEVERLEQEEMRNSVEYDDIWLPLLEGGTKVRFSASAPQDWIQFGEALNKAQEAVKNG